MSGAGRVFISPIQIPITPVGKRWNGWYHRYFSHSCFDYFLVWLTATMVMIIVKFPITLYISYMQSVIIINSVMKLVIWYVWLYVRLNVQMYFKVLNPLICPALTNYYPTPIPPCNQHSFVFDDGFEYGKSALLWPKNPLLRNMKIKSWDSCLVTEKFILSGNEEQKRDRSVPLSGVIII